MDLQLTVLFLFCFFVMASRAKSHEENRKVICSICYSESGQKPTRLVSKQQEIAIKTYVSQNFSLEDYCCPIGLCNKCRNKLDRVKAGEPATILNVSEYFGSSVPHVLRNQQCQCIICIRARLNGHQWKQFIAQLNKSKKETVSRLCPNCLCQVKN